MIALTDGSGKWFNESTAKKFPETLHFNGHNRISRATGSQFEHEALYRTQQNNWVLKRWSDWQGSKVCYEQIDDRLAAAWFCKNEYECKDIPQDIRDLVGTHIKELEL